MNTMLWPGEWPPTSATTDARGHLGLAVDQRDGAGLHARRERRDLGGLDVGGELRALGQGPGPELELGAVDEYRRVAECVEMAGVVVVQVRIDDRVHRARIDARAGQRLHRLHQELRPRERPPAALNPVSTTIVRSPLRSTHR